MTITVRAHTKLMSAVLAAGLVTAAAPVWVPPIQEAAPAISSEAVLPVSFVTDVLYNAGVAVNGVSEAIRSPLLAVTSVPYNAINALVTSIQDPDLADNVLSYLAQLYLSTNSGLSAYPYRVATGIYYIAYVLPAPIGDWAMDAIEGTINSVNSLFAGLPNPFPGKGAIDAFNATTIGRVLLATRYLINTPTNLIAEALTWLGYQAYEVEAALESAIRNPSEIPGLLSTLMRNVLDPNAGLLGIVTRNLVASLVLLPDPIGAGVQNVYDDLVDGWGDLLDALLPAPVTPTPFATAAADESGSVLATARVSDVPGGDPAVVTVDVPVESVDPVAPSDPGPATTGGVIDEQDDETGNETFSDDQELVDSEDEEQVVVDEIPADEEEITVDDEDNTDLAETDTEADEQSDETEPTADTDTDTDTDSPADNSTDNDTAAAA